MTKRGKKSKIVNQNIPNLTMLSIPQLVSYTIHRLDPKAEILLFGSRARGDFRSDSDWDFLILLGSQALTRHLKNQILDALYELELETGQVISALIHTKSDWEQRAITPIYRIIAKESKRA